VQGASSRNEHELLPSCRLTIRYRASRNAALRLLTVTSQTGATYPPSLLCAFALLCQEHHIALILDETYRDFLLDGVPHQLFSRPRASAAYSPSPDIPSGHWPWRSTLIHLFSFSKSYHIPGHRLGALIASPDFVRTATTVLDCLQICAPAPAQHALRGEGLLRSIRESINEDAAELEQRHTVFAKCLLESGSRWQIGTQGAYYAYVRHPFYRRTSREVCERLAREAGVLALPGEFFGEEEMSRWVRFSVANVDVDGVTEAARRISVCTKEWDWEKD
jgi:aspartate/methionine/tyrosine aminotransferase